MRTTSLLASAAVALALAGSASVAAASEPAGEMAPVVNDPSVILGQATPKQLAKARALSLPKAGGGSLQSVGSVPGVTGPQEAGDRISTAKRRTTTALPAAAKRSRRSTAYAGQELPWVSNGYGHAAPIAAVGRLFFRTPAGHQSFCTGTLVARNIVLTAAHCIREGHSGAWNSSWVFVPGANGTARPYGAWAARTALVPNAWSAPAFRSVPGTGGDGYFAMDYGFVVLHGDGAGRHAADRTGAFSMWANASRGSIYHLGYPGEGGWGGCTDANCRPWSCAAPTQRYNLYQGGKYDLGMSCSTTGGASGGPWFQRASNGSWYITSVMSHMGIVHRWAGGRFGVSFFGPYLDRQTLVLFNQARTL